MRRDLICRAAATTPAKRIFDLVRVGEREREKGIERGGGGEKERDEEGERREESYSNRAAAEFRERDTYLMRFFVDGANF